MESYVYTTTLMVAFIVSGFCSPEDTYYIKPLSNATCGNAQPCITLSEFAQRNSKPAKRTTLKFMPGEHMLSTNISIANRNSYTLIGLRKGIKDEKSIIKCEKNIGFTFSNMRYIRIHYLVFTSCGTHRSVGMRNDPLSAISQMFALFMNSILQIDITNSTFENNTGTALGVHNSRLMLDGNNSFIGNFRSCVSISSYSCQGGGLYSSNSSLMFLRYCSFVHNVADEGGGIYIQNSTLDVFGTISIQHNIAYRKSGGGINVESGYLHLCGAIEFLENLAKNGSGGGIYAQNLLLHFCEESSTIFAGNSALKWVVEPAFMTE